MGTGSTTLAAARCGRNSIGIEVDSEYFESALKRVHAESNDIFNLVSITAHG
jgi:DNA modification methylase